MRITLVAALAALAFAAPTRADQLLGQGRIDGSNRVVLPGGPTLGTFQGGKYTSTPDAIQSKGDITCTNPAGCDASALGTRGTLRPRLRSQADRVADSFNVRDYGAFGDGTAHTAQATLGITSLAGLANWSADNGASRPYAFVAAYPFGRLFNLPIAVAAASGSATLSFGVQQTTSAGSTLAGGYVYKVADVSGLVQGQTVTGNACAPAGTVVELVNPTTREVRTNLVTSCGASAVALTYRHPWLDRVEVGMQVRGPGIATGTTVAAILTNGVSLSSATTAALATRTLSSAATPANHAAEITFYRPFTDAEARALEMDGLGIQAAVLATQTGNGGQAVIPPGTYRTSHPIVFEVTAHDLHVYPPRSSDLVGGSAGAVFLNPVADFGPGTAVLSCGDPTGTRDNDRGPYAFNGAYCWGTWRGVTVRLPGADFAAGRRPVFQSQPVFMDGLRQGARREVVDVSATGFVHGRTVVGDHMTTSNTYFYRNWIGTRFMEPTKGLYADVLLSQTFDFENAWAGWSIAPGSTVSQMTAFKPYLGFQPYPIWLEPGQPAVGRALDQVDIQTPNAEYAGCGFIQDGNVAGQATNAGAARGITYSRITRPIVLRDATVVPPSGGAQPQGACSFQAYFDVLDLSGTSVEDISGPGVIFPPVAGMAGLARTQTVAQYGQGDPMAGGFRLSGSGVATILSTYGAACTEVVNTAGIGGNGEFDRIAVDVPGVMKGQPVVLADAPATALPRGTVLEGTPGNSGFGLYAQRAGLASVGTAAILGVSAQDHSACAMQGKTVIVATRAPYAMVRTTTAIGGAQLLKTNPGTPGTAAPAASTTDGQVFGVSSGTTGQSTSTQARINLGP